MEKQLQEKFTTIAKNQNAIKELGISEGISLGIKEAAANSKYIEKQASGSIISLNDVSEVYHKVKVYGDNQEVKVYGKNLLPYPYYSRTSTVNGITFTVNEDGTVTANGTATQNAIFSLVRDTSTNLLKLTTGEAYTLSGCPAGGSGYKYQLYAIGGITMYDTGNGTTKTAGNDNAVSVFIVVYSGFTVSNLVFKPVLRLASITDNAYEPYTKQTITATPVGTEIDSMCPNMNFFADEDITVDYYSSFGMQTEYDRFWDGYQNHGNRRDYSNAFAGAGWNDTTFKPKYDMVVTSGGNLFLGSKITDIVKRFDECGVALDTSNCSSFSYSMQGMMSKSFPLLDLSASTSATTNLFNSCPNLEYIVGIVSSEKTKFNNTSFGSCPKLTHVIFSGVIASDINLQWSPLLDDESLISLATCLKSYGLVDTQHTITLSPNSWARMEQLKVPGIVMSLVEHIDAIGGWERA